MKKLIAIDYDGTLENGSKEVSTRAQTVISKLVELGNVIVICTARSRYHTREIALNAKASRYIISSNGAEIYDIEKEQVLYDRYLDENDCIILLNYAIKNNLRIIFSCKEIEYVTNFTRNDKQILISKEVDAINFFKGKNVKQCMIIDKNIKQIEKSKEELETLNMNLKINNFSNNEDDEKWFTLINKLASKGEAIKELAKYLNIPTCDLIGIGNDYNDIPMFENVGTSIAVENSDTEVKKRANIIIESNSSDGVAKYLETLLNQNKK